MKRILSILCLISFLLLLLSASFAVQTKSNPGTASTTSKLPLKNNSQPPEEDPNAPAIETITKVVSQFDPFKAGKYSAGKYAVAFIEVALSDLKFYNRIPTGEVSIDLTDSIKKFQQSIRQSSTGVMTNAQLEILIKNQTAILPQEVHIAGISSTPSISWDNAIGYVSVSGTWTQKDNAFPINLSQIDCYKDQNSCLYISVNFGNIGIGPSLLLQTDHYNITKWSDNEITAQSESHCMIDTLIINNSSNEVYTITTNNTNQEKCDIGMGLMFPKFKTPLIAKLVGNGYDIAHKYYLKEEDEKTKLYNPEYSQAIKKLIPPSL